MTLDEASMGVGRGVVYLSAPDVQPEAGVIVSTNDWFVFVRYGAEKLSKATRPEDLVFG